MFCINGATPRKEKQIRLLSASRNSPKSSFGLRLKKPVAAKGQSTTMSWDPRGRNGSRNRGAKRGVLVGAKSVSSCLCAPKYGAGDWGGNIFVVLGPKYGAGDYVEEGGDLPFVFFLAQNKGRGGLGNFADPSLPYSR